MDFDVVLVGGGLAGASLSALLPFSLKVAIIDKNAEEHWDQNVSLEETPMKPKESTARALALSNTTIQFLQALDIWPQLFPFAYPIKTVQVSKQGFFGITKLEAHKKGLEALGYVVDADRLTQVLQQKVYTLSHISKYSGQTVEALCYLPQKGYEITLSSKEKITTKLLVASDGQDSSVRNQLGIETHVEKNDMMALVVNLELSSPQHPMAFERFLREGSIAMLPFGKQHRKCVWIAPNLNERVLHLSKQALLDTLQEQFGFQLGKFVNIGTNTFYPLKTLRASALYTDRAVLIGNAANTILPVAAQGFNLLVRDVAQLAELLIEQVLLKKDIGEKAVLQTYQTLRSSDHTSIHRWTQQLHNRSLLQWFGIVASEMLPTFKNRFLEKGLGKSTPLPKLCRGFSLDEIGRGSRG